MRYGEGEKVGRGWGGEGVVWGRCTVEPDKVLCAREVARWGSVYLAEVSGV